MASAAMTVPANESVSTPIMAVEPVLSEKNDKDPEAQWNGQPEELPNRPIRKRWAQIVLVAMVLVGLGARLWIHQLNSLDLSHVLGQGLRPCHETAPNGKPHKGKHGKHSKDKDVCTVLPIVRPGNSSLDLFKSEVFKTGSALKMSGAVQIPTVSTELYGPPDQDSNWDVFADYHKYLEETFPLIHAQLEKTVVNKYGLVYKWRPSKVDSSLKPALITAHMDVVPVLPETLADWDFPPFEGHYDGTFVWGRGASDCKDLMIAILEAVEQLLVDGIEPSREFVFAFGFDEESSGDYGAGAIAPYLYEQYGPDSFEILIDEGGEGVQNAHGFNMAVVGVGEKGRYANTITLKTPGGHASRPPAHSGIGIVAELITEIEKNPFDLLYTDQSPFFDHMTCLATHSKTMPHKMRRALLRANKDKHSNRQAIKELVDAGFGPYLQTTQAIDIIHGGLKINALPESVSFDIDHRVAAESSLAEVEARVIKDIKSVAKKHGISIRKGDTVLYNSKKNPDSFFELTPYPGNIEPAPVSPYTDEVWAKFAGTIRHVFEEFAGPLPVIESDASEWVQGKDIVVVPDLEIGNTDTAHYWNLTRHIYRFNPSRSAVGPNNSRIHTVNEKVNIDFHVESVVFYYEFLQVF